MTDDGVVGEDGPEVTVDIAHVFRGDIKLDLVLQPAPRSESKTVRPMTLQTI